MRLVVLLTLGGLCESQRAPKSMEQCASTFAKPFELTELTTSTLFADEWPNPLIHCSARYWSYGAVGRITMPGREAAADSPASAALAYAALLNASRPISRCCRLPLGKERDLLEQAWGAKLFAPLEVAYARGAAAPAALVAQPLCPASVAVVQNPLALALHSARWLGGCPRDVAAPYRERATRDASVGRERRYPFALAAPFIFAFDWVVAPAQAGQGKWRTLGAVRPPNAGRTSEVGLYVQRAIPQLIYCLNGRPHLALLRKRILPFISSAAFTGKVVVYIGNGGFAGPPSASAELAEMAGLRNVAAVYVEGSTLLSPDERPPNLHSAPPGFCARDAVEYSASLVESVARAPAFDARFRAVFGCFPVDLHGDEDVRGPLRKEMRLGALLAFCSGRPNEAPAKRSAKAPSVLDAPLWQDEDAPVLEADKAGDEGGAVRLKGGGGRCHTDDTGPADARARLLWRNASRFKFAFAPSEDGVLEFLLLGCVVLTPHFFGAERHFARLPVHFLRPTTPQQQQSLTRRRALQEGGSDDAAMFTGQADVLHYSLSMVTDRKLVQIEQRLGSLARDVTTTRRLLQPGYWASRLREHL